MRVAVSILALCIVDAIPAAPAASHDARTELAQAERRTAEEPRPGRLPGDDPGFRQQPGKFHWRWWGFPHVTPPPPWADRPCRPPMGCDD